MKFSCMATALNLRSAPRVSSEAGSIKGEFRLGDTMECADEEALEVWVPVTGTSGACAGMTGYVRRKWLAQCYDAPLAAAQVDRGIAEQIIDARTAEFDFVHYNLGDKAHSFAELREKKYIDCSGWVHLLAQEVAEASGIRIRNKELDTFSDQQVTNIGALTGKIISGPWLNPSLFQAGCLVGIDFSEYTWDRDRPLDIDHIVIVGRGATEDGKNGFISQSSSSGAGVNRVPLDKWLRSVERLAAAGRVHLVDLLALPAM